MPGRFSAASILRRRGSLLAIVAIVAIAGFGAMLQPRWPGNYAADADPAVDQLDSSNELQPRAEQPQFSNAETWKIPKAEPRDRSERPLLELVGVFTGNGRHRTALIREKDGPTGTYRVGDKLTGNRELIEIHDGYVLLRNDEYIERLRLGNRRLEPQYRPEDLESWAEQLVGGSRGAKDQGGESR